VNADETRTITLTVNGQRERHRAEPREHLVDFLRRTLRLTGAHLGCEHGVCGACTVRIDGKIVRGCLVLAVQADGCRIDTIEGLGDDPVVADLQAAFLAHNAMQCGFCSSGMLLAAAELVACRPEASREDVRLWVSGNYCRCTGYHAIVDAVCDVLRARKTAAASESEP
jgi:carbon-monoxide dehydrogenase small subunit